MTINIPWPLYEIYLEHAPEVGYHGTKTTAVNNMLVWGPLFSLLVGKPHYVTAPIADMPPDLQDEILAGVIAAYQRGEFKHGSFFEAMTAEVVEKLKLPITPEAFRDLLSNVICNRPRKKKDAPTPVEK